MSKYITSILLVGSVVAVSACTVRTSTVAEGEASQAASGEEFVIIEPAPISNEPVFTGKYK